MESKKFLFFLVITLILSFTNFPAIAQEVIKLKFSTGYPPPPDLTAVDHVWFMDEVKKRTKGRVTFDVFWGGALGKPLEHIDMIKRGVADIGRVPLLFHPDRAPLWAYEFAFPFAPGDPEDIAKVWWKLHDEFPIIQKQLEKDNQIALQVTLIDDYHLLSRVPLKTLADLKGKLVGASGIYFPKQLEVVGSKAHISPMGERYMQLKLGTIDANHGPIEYIRGFKLFEVGKHLLITNIGAWASGAVTMNLDAWKKIPPDIQKVFGEVGKEAGVVHGKRLKEEREKDIKFLKEQGVTFYTLSEAEKEKWASMVPDLPGILVKDLEGKGFPAGKYLKRWYEEHKKLGHKWYYTPTW
ncbi:MAG: hypothetical protein FJ130_01380 [Deltaproteobacteria bacterium]|nr:hypothetical protein [Deltaproteobacteria bacterium]